MPFQESAAQTYELGPLGSCDDVGALLFFPESIDRLLLGSLRFELLMEFPLGLGLVSDGCPHIWVLLHELLQVVFVHGEEQAVGEGHGFVLSGDLEDDCGVKH